LATSPLSTAKFRNLFAGCWLLWIALHTQVLVWFGFPFKLALTDSLISNLLLIGLCLQLMTVLKYYLPQQNRYSFLFGLSVLKTVLWFFISRALIKWMANDSTEYHSFFSQSVPVRIAIAFLILGCMTLISVLWFTLQDQREIEKRKAEADKLAKDAELYTLRQQLQPHFLFNSLNSINALITIQPQQARTMIQQLSDFLRGTLKKEEQQWISLEEELQHLQLYLDIEKVRFGHRLETQLINKATDAALPAMLLQPIVENAIKFGLYDTTGQITICIYAEKKDQQLIVSVSNPFDPQTSSKKGTGFGLSSVQRRLYLLFSRSDLLQTETKEDHFITTIKIPQP
jgi:two-component sensor histidine kinase